MMTTKKKRWILATLIATGCALPLSTASADVEPERYTNYYEDDAWYDITEWFDGNDYNPTDEAIGRWDNETFDFDENVSSTDQDNDWNVRNDFGYYANRTDWFYDHYDDGYASFDNNYYSVYYDTDDDGLYDAYSFYSDRDGDGLYEDFDYYTFDSSTEGQREAQQQARMQQKQMRSRPIQVSGQVAQTKTVDVRGKKHLVAHVQTDNGKRIVDLGRNAEKSLKQGDQITASGVVMKVGDKNVLLAAKAQLPSGTVDVQRDGRKYSGTIDTLKTVSIRNEKHQFAKVKTEQGKSLMVDLGPTNSNSGDFREGEQLTVEGAPLKIKDRVLLMARRVKRNGEMQEIKRSNES